MRERILTVVFVAALLTGCPQRGLTGPGTPPPSPYACKDTPEKPYIVEWNSDERSELQRRAERGVVVVKYGACKLEFLERCTVASTYRWASVTPKQDRISIRSTDQLWANIPVYGVRFEGALKEAGELTIETLRVGAWELPARIDANALKGVDCDQATHVISGIAVGAFALSAGSGVHVHGGVDVAGAGGGYDRERSQSTLSKDGRFEACDAVAKDKPNEACGALIRIELTKLGAASHTCKPGDIDECTRQCALDEEVSCQRLAAALATKHEDGRAAELFKRGCDRDDQRACNNLGVQLARGKKMTHDLVRARQIFAKACDAGVAEACVNAGVTLSHDEHGSMREDPMADRRFRQGCTARVGLGCYLAGSKLNDDGRTYAARDAEALLASGCDLDNGDACAELSRLVAPRDPARAKAVEKRACQLGIPGTCGVEAEHAYARDLFSELIVLPPP